MNAAIHQRIVRGTLCALLLTAVTPAAAQVSHRLSDSALPGLLPLLRAQATDYRTATEQRTRIDATVAGYRATLRAFEEGTDPETWFRHNVPAFVPTTTGAYDAACSRAVSAQTGLVSIVDALGMGDHHVGGWTEQAQRMYRSCAVSRSR